MKTLSCRATAQASRALPGALRRRSVALSRKNHNLPVLKAVLTATNGKNTVISFEMDSIGSTKIHHTDGILNIPPDRPKSPLRAARQLAPHGGYRHQHDPSQKSKPGRRFRDSQRCDGDLPVRKHIDRNSVTGGAARTAGSERSEAHREAPAVAVPATLKIIWPRPIVAPELNVVPESGILKCRR